MKKLALLLYFFNLPFANLIALSPNPDYKQSNTPLCMPIAKVKAREWDAKQVCVEGVLLKKNDDDEFVLQDKTDAIILFLPTDKLIELNLQEGAQVQVIGTIDYSMASRNRTELYANKITIMK